MRIGTCRVLIALTLSVGTAAAVSYSVEAQAVEFLVFGSSDFNAGNTLSLSGAVTLSNTDSGWWRSDGEHRDFNNNYAVRVDAARAATNSEPTISLSSTSAT